MRYFFIVTLLIFSVSLKAQTRSKISGKVMDSLTQKAVDYASVGLYKAGSTAPIDGVVTDKNGNFTLNNVKNGDYKVTIDFIGYKRKIVDHLKVDDTHQQIKLSSILLMPLANALKEVTVTTTGPVVVNKIDKIVYNAENDLTSQGGVATDVLKKVPQVTVDIDGNVELLGNSGVKFLIDGKPSAIFGSSVADALQSIPADQIKSIEVISSPGAKYDAAGTAGIINIILKKNKIYGVNGSVNLSAGSRRNEGSVSLNAKKGNLGISTYFNGNARFSSNGLSGTHRNSFFSDTTNTLIQDGRNGENRHGIRTGLSLDWDINKYNNINASVGYDEYNRNSNGLTHQQNTTYKGSYLLSDALSILNSNSKGNEHSTDLGLAYKKTFKKEDEELDLEFHSGLGGGKNSYLQNQSNVNTLIPFSGLSSNNIGKDNEYEFNIDYTLPVSARFTLETGAKTIFNTIKSNALVNSLDPNSSEYVPNPSQSNRLDYKRNIYAYYLSGTYKLWNWLDVKSGLRYERTISDANYSQVGNININPYNTFAPSVVIAHNYKNNNSIKLSYSYRIERPDYEDLNPFIDLSDPRNARTGNPNLKPEIGNNFELGFNKAYKKGGNLNIAAFYRHNGHDVKPYSTFYPTFTVGDSTYQNVTLTTRLNVGQEINEGINISGSIPFGSKLTIRPNVFFSYQTIINNYSGGPNVSGFRVRGNVNGSYEFNSNFSMELFGFYHSAENNVQGRRPGFFFYSLAFRKQLFKKKGSIGLSASNPFNQYIKQTSNLATVNSNSNSYRSIPFRSFGIVFSYRFGKLDFKNDSQQQPDLSGGL